MDAASVKIRHAQARISRPTSHQSLFLIKNPFLPFVSSGLQRPFLVLTSCGLAHTSKAHLVSCTNARDAAAQRHRHAMGRVTPHGHTSRSHQRAGGGAKTAEGHVTSIQATRCALEVTSAAKGLAEAGLLLRNPCPCHQSLALAEQQLRRLLSILVLITGSILCRGCIRTPLESYLDSPSLP